MAGPYGLAYGLGQMASAYLPGKMAGQQLSLDQERQRTVNAMQGLQLKGMQREEEDKALDDEIMSNIPEDIYKGQGYMTPQAKQAAMFSYLADQYGERGKGQKAMALHQKAVEAQSGHMAQMGGLGAQALMRGNFDSAKKYFNEATQITGDPIESIEPAQGQDGRNAFKVKTKSNPNGMTLGLEDVAFMASQPDKIPGLIMSAYGKDMNYAIKEMVERNKEKRAAANIEFKMKKLESEEAQKNLDRMGRETVARINAGGRVAAVATNAINQFVKNKARVKMAEDPNLSPEQAQADAYEESKRFGDEAKLDAEARRSSNEVLRFGIDTLTGGPKPGWETAVSDAKRFLGESIQKRPEVKPTASPSPQPSKSESRPAMPRKAQVPAPAKAQGGLPSPKTKNEFDRLAPGTKYIAPDGTVREK